MVYLWYGMVWYIYGMVWYGIFMVWYGMVWWSWLDSDSQQPRTESLMSWTTSTTGSRGGLAAAMAAAAMEHTAASRTES